MLEAATAPVRGDQTPPATPPRGAKTLRRRKPPADGGGGERGEEGDWTREELEEWATQEPAPQTPAIAVLPSGRAGEDVEEETGMGASLAADFETGAGPDPPVVTRVLPPGLEVRRGGVWPLCCCWWWRCSCC